MTLDADVLRLLQDEMHRTRSSFKQSLNQAVRRALTVGQPRKSEAFVLRPGPRGLRPGIDDTRLGQFADQLEDKALVERMRRAEAAAAAIQERATKKRRGRS